jgi:hypothetical protein
MALILGFFDLLAYAIPGALYLATFAYVAGRAGWIDVPTVLQAPSLLLLITLTVGAFLVGQAATPLGGLVDRLNPFGSAVSVPEQAKEEFLRRNAGAAPRRFLETDPYTLLAAIEVRDKEAATDVVRLRSTAAMLSRAAPALVLAAVVAVVEAFTGPLPLFAVLTGVVLAVVAIGCLVQSVAFRRWVVIRTYELCFWDDDLDGRIPGRSGPDEP